ncbi:MAG: YiiD C-terminal domain-containing protein [Ktedonobacterales bacterium]
MDELLRELQHTLNHEIPLTRHLGLRVNSYNDEEGLSLWAPISPNLNHKSTAFAGSLNSILTLGGWSLVWILLNEWGMSGTVVIQESTCHYRLPVHEDFVARCRRPPKKDLERFEAQIRGRGKGRLELSVEICQGEREAVTFWGRYVVHIRPPKPPISRLS